MRVLDNGCAYWLLGSIVEVGLHTADHDPNTYRARCLTGGTFPLLQVLDDKYPEPMQCTAVNSPIVIWKEIAVSAEAEEEAEAAEEERLNGVQEEVRMFVIIGCKPGNIRVGRRESDEEVQGGFDSIEDARDWIERNECEECGQLKTDAAGEGCTRRHLGAAKEFSF
jgi:hypothetical protein